ncbi:AI-2E family transporter [Agromyces protaetiae]|uniref:AI-2E family transporter n=1 Tax=Agromyces protaetiae TaxID=2509455 RepID=A0A4P6FE58_9MICO|nr:AI-2E family transporter [Agromyces protaetiae]QAY71957.1 AI-2E family transporter [Agromyces protaetiae]
MAIRITPRRSAPVEPQPAAEITADGDSRGPEVKIRAFRVGFVGALGVLAALLLGGVVGQLSTVILYVVFALFLALGLDPVISFLERWMPRWVAILVIVFVILGLIAILVATIVPIIVEQTTNVIDNWDEIVQNIQNSAIVTWAQGVLPPDFNLDKQIQDALTWLSDFGHLASLGGGVLAVGAGIAGGFTGVVIVLILMLYFMASLRSMEKYSARFVPASSRKKYLELTGEITDSVGRYVIGQASLGLINGVLSFIYLSIIGAPSPILLAFIAFLCSLVPLVGTLTGAIVISLVCLAAGWPTALAAIIYYLVYMQVEAYVVSPRIMSRAVSVPGALVVIAAVAGGTLGGVLGALVAIPVAASLIIIVEKVVFPRQDTI